MPVRRRKNSWMVDFWIEPPGQPRQRVRKLVPVPTKRAALEYERRLREELLLGTPARKEVPTLKDFSAEFLRNYAATSNRPGEQEEKKRNLSLHLLPALGKLRLDEIDRRVIDAFKAMQLAKGLHPNTVNHHLATLSRALNMAVEWGQLDHAPKVVLLRFPPTKFDFLTFEEADRLLAASGEDRTLVLTLLRTGLRVGEVVALKWETVDLVARKLVVRAAFWRNVEGPPKSGRTREVPLASDLVAALRAHRHLRGSYVFCHGDGRPLTRHNVATAVERTARRAGLRRIGVHVVRHTFASHLVMRGVPLKVVQELLGHADLRMTLRYAHLAPVVHRDAVEVLADPSRSTVLGTIWAPAADHGELGSGASGDKKAN
jgi:integrase